MPVPSSLLSAALGIPLYGPVLTITGPPRPWGLGVKCLKPSTMSDKMGAPGTKNSPVLLNYLQQPWLVGLGWLSVVPCTKSLPV